jgi:Tfp pilus assembly protein PilF
MIESLLQAERLLVVGQVDAAEKIYSSTLAADPHNSIAVVGLARVALERGDDRLAYQHACAALEIDRQNAAALRLEARLSEVLATRGEPVRRPAWLAQPVESAAPPPADAEPKKRRSFLGRILRG